MWVDAGCRGENDAPRMGDGANGPTDRGRYFEVQRYQIRSAEKADAVLYFYPPPQV